MSLIFRIAAGVVIAYLILMIINLKFSQYLHDEQVQKHAITAQTNMTNTSIDVLKNKIKRGIDNYFKQHQSLPQYIADLFCKPEQSCDVRFYDTTVSEGVYYTKNFDYLVAMKPTIQGRAVVYQCRFNSLTEQVHQDTTKCQFDSSLIIPERKQPSFDCQSTRYYADNIVCSSDRLIDLDLEMAALYKKVTSRGFPQDREKIKVIHNQFLKQRNRCQNSRCVEKQLRSRIKELELNDKYGV